MDAKESVELLEKSNGKVSKVIQGFKRLRKITCENRYIWLWLLSNHSHAVWTNSRSLQFKANLCNGSDGHCIGFD